MTDVGLRLLDSLYEQLMIDDQWAVRTERGFTWWAYRLAQHVEIGPPEWSVDRYVCSVRIWTDVVRDVVPNSQPAGVLGATNAFSTLSALVWDPSEATITECCTAAVHDEIFEWMSKVLATAAVLQNTAAHSRAHLLAQATGGVPDASNHPSSGERPTMDEILNVPQDVIAREGQKQSHFVGAHFARVEEFLRENQFFGSATPDGLTCEFPFTGAAPAVSLSDPAELQTSLLQIFTDVPHPEAGNGLLCLLRLPYSSDPQDVADRANMLNLIESAADGPTPLLGAWCPEPSAERNLAFCAFVPNLLAQLVLVENLISYMWGHSRVALAQLTGELTLKESGSDPCARTTPSGAAVGQESSLNAIRRLPSGY